jgi:hypothetical protein
MGSGVTHELQVEFTTHCDSHRSLLNAAVAFFATAASHSRSAKNAKGSKIGRYGFHLPFKSINV